MARSSELSSRSTVSESGRAQPGEASVEEAIRRVFAPHLGSAAGRGLWSVWRGVLRELRPLGDVSLGNRVRVLFRGEQVYAAMWEAIEGAQREVRMTTYVLEPDVVGRRTLSVLRDAARRGCRVTLVVDAVGSFRLGERDLGELRAAGGVVLVYNPLLRWNSNLSRLERNHRKILTVDGRLGFAGGMNVAEEYAAGELGSGYFRDTHLVLEGPCVSDLARLVGAEFEGASSDGGGSSARGPTGDVVGGEGVPGGSRPGGSMVQILESNVRRQRRAIQRAMRTTLDQAVQRCEFTNPYFVPPRRFLRALRRAAARGVQVRILTAGLSDVPIMRWASEHLYGQLLAAGVRIFELQGKALHAKTMSADGVYGAVGSFNLDQWSDRRNLEVNVSFLDEPAARELEAQFERDLEDAREVCLDDWNRRGRLRAIWNWIAYQLMRL